MILVVNETVIETLVANRIVDEPANDPDLLKDLNSEPELQQPAMHPETVFRAVNDPEVVSPDALVTAIETETEFPTYPNWVLVSEHGSSLFPATATEIDSGSDFATTPPMYLSSAPTLLDSFQPFESPPKPAAAREAGLCALRGDVLLLPRGCPATGRGGCPKPECSWVQEGAVMRMELVEILASWFGRHQGIWEDLVVDWDV